MSLQDLLLYTFYFMLFHIRIGHFCHGFNNISRNVSDKFVYVSVMLTTSYMSVALLSITNRSINHFNNTQVYSSDTQRLLWFSPFWHLHPSIPFVSKKKKSNLGKSPLLSSTRKDKRHMMTLRAVCTFQNKLCSG